MRGILLLVATGALLLAGVVGATDPEPPDCFERIAVAQYLHRMQDRILAAWSLPIDSASDDEVVVSLRIDEDGMLTGYELVSYGSRRLALSAMVAVMMSSPFELMEADVRCLAGRPIVTTLRNPTD